MKRTIAGQWLIVLAMLPSVAVAQRGGMGGMGSRGGGGRAPSMNASRSVAVEIPKYVNPINLLIQHRQDLVLTDSQFARVIRVKRAIDSTNAPLMRRLDSVQVLFKGAGPLFGDGNAERRDSIASAKAVVQETVAAVRGNLLDARDNAYGFLSSTQLAKARDFEDKAQHELDDEKEERGRGRGGSGKPPAD